MVLLYRNKTFDYASIQQITSVLKIEEANKK